ncbi:MAG: hypothetical protein JWL62_2293 [Hyphomicrobiales bacterium]|jgi:hypothetical protein|nr:hypothetical protein [Hyphomicrobiales bacterium]
MTHFQQDYDSARRHLGVAMIDLRYSAADLALSAHHRSGDAAHETWTAVDLLNQEIANLLAISNYIDGIGQAPAIPAPPNSPAADLQRWWPHLIREQARDAEMKEE